MPRDAAMIGRVLKPLLHVHGSPGEAAHRQTNVGDPHGPHGGSRPRPVGGQIRRRHKELGQFL